MPLRLIAATIALCLATTAQAATVRASWYWEGHRTASGERFRPDGLTAAHRSLRFGTRVRVSYRGRSVVVRITDRGPARWTHRSLDLSRGAARALGMIGRGVAVVRMEVQ